MREDACFEMVAKGSGHEAGSLHRHSEPLRKCTSAVGAGIEGADEDRGRTSTGN